MIRNNHGPISCRFPRETAILEENTIFPMTPDVTVEVRTLPSESGNTSWTKNKNDDDYVVNTVL